MPANANGGRSSLSANQTTSFFLVSGFGSGAYSAKLLAGTKQRLAGFNHPRQGGDDAATGDFGVIRKFGDVPDDLSAL